MLILELLVRDDEIPWHHRVSQNRSLWRRLRSPISGLGMAPKAGLSPIFPRADAPLSGEFSDPLRQESSAVPEGAWWLRTTLREAGARPLQGNRCRSPRDHGRVTLQVHHAESGDVRLLEVDHARCG